jgi:hypothetical protein
MRRQQRHRPPEAERRQQQEAGGRRAGDGAHGIPGREPPQHGADRRGLLLREPQEEGETIPAMAHGTARTKNAVPNTVVT